MNLLIDDNKGIRSKLNSRVTTILVIVLVVPKLILNCFMHVGYLMDTWPACQLCVNYSYGFVKRAFLGTIVSLFSSSTGISYENSVISMMLIEEVLFSLVILTVLIFVINSFKDESLNLLIILFISLNLMGFYYNYWGEADIVLMTLTLISCVLIVRKKLLVLVPVLVSLCVLIHEGYVMMYLGLVIALLLYAIGNNYKGSGTQYAAVLVSTVIAAFVLFVYMYFCTADSIYVTSEYFCNYLSDVFSFSDPYLYEAVNYTYFGTGLPHGAMWVEGRPTSDFYIRMLAVLINALALSPLIYYKVTFYRRLIQDESSSKNKLIWIMCSAASLLTLPLILVQTDEGRWFYDIVFSEFMIVLFLYILDSKRISFQLQKIFKCSYLNIILCVFYLLLYADIDLEKIML